MAAKKSRFFRSCSIVCKYSIPLARFPCVPEPHLVVFSQQHGIQIVLAPAIASRIEEYCVCVSYKDSAAIEENTDYD